MFEVVGSYQHLRQLPMYHFQQLSFHILETMKEFLQELFNHR